jgi:SPP1 family predicted phage head-tail adaptor
MTRAHVEIGDLRQRVAIEAPIDAADDAGSMTRSYSPIGTVWAQILPASGESRFAASRQETVITHIVHIRWRSDIQSQMRFSIGSRHLLIHACFDPDGRRALLFCRCEEISR